MIAVVSFSFFSVDVEGSGSLGSLLEWFGEQVTQVVWRGCRWQVFGGGVRFWPERNFVARCIFWCVAAVKVGVSTLGQIRIGVTPLYT